MRLAVTGATGELGGRVAARLAELGIAQRLVVRDPGRAPRLAGADVAQASGYGAGEELRRALEGADTLFLVSAGEAEDRVALHLSAVDAAVAAGVSRIVYTSFLAAATDATFTLARDHHATEERIRASGVAFTFLRSSLYLDLIPLWVSPAGEIRGPAGDGRVAAVAREQIADVAVAVLTSGGHDGLTYDVTGREAFTLAAAAAELEAITGRQIVFIDETLEEARASRAGYGAPDWGVEGWVSSYAAIGAGELDVISDVVPRLTGRDPLTLAEWVRGHPESVAHLSPNG